MAPVQTFQVVLNVNGPPVFKAGDAVNGVVILDLTEPLKMRNIRIQLFGGSTVHWSERHGSGKHRHTDYYSNEEIYFNETFAVWGRIGGDSAFHPAGYYNYPFHINLPPQLPGSFESYHANVRYSVTATIDIPWGFDHVRTMAYTVLPILDLNTLANVRLPMTVSNFNTVCCLCCRSGPVTGTIYMDRTGFVPGEFIPFRADIDNKSRREISTVTCRLNMAVTCHSRTKTRCFTDTVAEVVMNGTIKMGGTLTWTGGQLHVPPLPPSYLTGCRIIQIQYYLVLSVEPNGPCARTLESTLPIVIGTVPIQNISYRFSTTPYQLQGQVLPTPGATPRDVLYYTPQASSSVDSPPNPIVAPYGLGATDLHDPSIQNENTPGRQMYTPMYPYYSVNK